MIRAAIVVLLADPASAGATRSPRSFRLSLDSTNPTCLES
jgi:hypothetical protein